MYKLFLRYLVTFLGIFLLWCIFNFHTTRTVSEPISPVISQANFMTIDFSKKRFDKFIFPPSAGCVGMGNQLFRIAALYGIGIHPSVNRTPGVSESEDCLANYIKEFSEIFPNVVKLVEFVVSLFNMVFKNILVTGFE